jgi:hypothetical protein
MEGPPKRALEGAEKKSRFSFRDGVDSPFEFSDGSVQGAQLGVNPVLASAHFSPQGIEARIHLVEQISDISVQIPDHAAKFTLVGVIQQHVEGKNREDNEADYKYVGHLATPWGYVVFKSH